MTFDLHHVFQDIMKEKAHVMSGYEIAMGQREARTHIQVDYFCAVNHNRPYGGPGKRDPTLCRFPTLQRY